MERMGNFIMEKICVYTCITGDYDNVNEIEVKEKNIDYYLFTNNKSITSSTWQVVYIEDPKLSNVKLARKIKILGHPLIKDNYDISIWIDGAMIIRGSIHDFILKACDLKQYNMVGFKHRERDCIYEEATSCLWLQKESEDIIRKYIDFLEKEKYPHHNGLIESTILVRRHNDPLVQETME